MNIEMTATLIVPLLIQENNNHKQRYQFIGKSRCKKMEIMAGRHLRPSSCNPVIYLFHIRQGRPTKHTHQFDDGFKKDHYVQIKIKLCVKSSLHSKVTKVRIHPLMRADNFPSQECRAIFWKCSPIHFENAIFLQTTSAYFVPE